MFINARTVIIHSEPRANNNRAFIVDIVLVYDIELDKMLKSMPVAEYFANKKTLERENQYALFVHSMSVVPGKSYMPLEIPEEKGRIVVNCIIFCSFPQVFNYIPKKIIAGDLQKIQLILSKDGALLLLNQEK